MFPCKVKLTVILELQVPNATHRQKQLGYSDRCQSSSKGPKGMGPSGGWEAALSLRAGPEGDWQAASGSQLPAGLDLFKPALFLMFFFLPVFLHGSSVY